MKLSQLNITHFRNIEAASIAPGAQFNVFYGENGSGKTSVLEAIYFLSMVKSFRSHLGRYIVQDDQTDLAVYAEVQHAEDLLAYGVSKTRGGELLMKRDGEPVGSQGLWVQHLPVLLCNHDTYQLLDAGPKVRRQFIDWGVFHVKHDFYPQWQALQKVLRQRNAALRAELPTADIMVWDAQLVEATLAMTVLRREYLARYLEIFQQRLAQFMAVDNLAIDFYQGWSEGQDYGLVLQETLHRDRQYGYTRQGAHRADLKFIINGKPADEVLSRGQQKVFVAAMKLAQGEMLREIGKNCLYLVDDLPSELDEGKQKQLIDLLRELQSQVFVTGISQATLVPLFDAAEVNLFHVKQGSVSAVSD